jgi:SAM-dependent methyltransferase
VTGSNAEQLREINRRFYDRLWSDVWLVPPEQFNTWPILGSLVTERQGDLPADRLEIGPGLRPRLPLQGTSFLDISAPALARLREAGGRCVRGDAASLPFADGAFDLICALDVIEHVGDDAAAFAELARVARPGAVLLLAVPLHPDRWTGFDAVVGHGRRYDPAALLALLSAHGFVVDRSGVFGMRPRAAALVGLGMWFLATQRRRAMWWYNRLIMPLGLRRQRALALGPGLADTSGIDEVLLLCHRSTDAPPHRTEAGAATNGATSGATSRGCDHAREPA